MLLLYQSPRTLIRLFDSERSEADLQLAPNMAVGVTSSSSLMNGITVESFKIEDTTLKIKDLQQVSATSGDLSVPTKNGDMSVPTENRDVSIPTENDLSVPTENDDLFVPTQNSNVSVLTENSDVSVLTENSDVSVLTENGDVSVLTENSDVSVLTENSDVSVAIHTGDVAVPTENGGFSHTNASRAKISAANKGKTPWNKGKARSEETRARIAAGVRAKNREKYLQKLKDLNVTEEEYEEQKKAIRKKKDKEQRARKTDKGGYRPTDETKKKISNILKKKWADGTMKKRTIDKTKVRRGFTHSEETRKKISESLRKRWSEDTSYRDEMTEKTTKANTKEETRKRISETLKAKWRDPEFRSKMMEKIQTRKPSTSNLIRGESYREKISAAMKAKWQDKEYRDKTLLSIRKRSEEAAKRRALRPPSSPVPRKKKN